MNRATQIALVERVHALRDQGATDMAPGVFEQPVAKYTDPARLARETATLFRRYPLVVAHGSALAAPGDFLTHDEAGVPLLVVRGADGVVRAFFNVCRHRGTRLVSEPRGHGKSAFVCRYHAWRYSTGGALEALPGREGFTEQALAQRGLVALPCAEKHGFVWVLPTPGAALELDAYLGPLGEELAGYGFASQARYKPIALHRKLNWKLAFDVFLEGYHVRYAHSRTIAKYFFDNVGVYERFGPHLRNLFPKRSIETLRGTERAHWELRAHANVLYVLFPNTLVLVQPDHASVFHVFPDGTDAARIVGGTLIPRAPADEREAGYWDKNIEILMSATDEDYALGEQIQSGLRSGANETLLFGRFEQSLAWFHTAVDAAIAGEPRRLPVVG